LKIFKFDFCGSVSEYTVIPAAYPTLDFFNASSVRPSFSHKASMDFSQSTGLIFDCDGTLADTMPLHCIAWRTTLIRHGFRFSEEQIYELAGTPTVSIVRLLQREQNVSGDPVAIAYEKENEFLNTLDQVEPIEPVVEIARRHRATHLMGVGSGSTRDVVLRILKHIGLDDFFDTVIGAEDTKKHKPEPDVFLEVARRIQVAPSSCCVFEDADLGIESARRAGMTHVDIRTLHTPRRIS